MFSKEKKTLSVRKLDLNVRRKLVKCYIRSIDLCSAEIWTLDYRAEVSWKF
jgi:hypothetical protein